MITQQSTQPVMPWGNTLGAFHQTKMRIEALARAQVVHGLLPDWFDAFGHAEQVISEHGQPLDEDTLDVWNVMLIIERAFTALAIDMQGNPLPGANRPAPTNPPATGKARRLMREVVARLKGKGSEFAAGFKNGREAARRERQQKARKER